MQIGETRANLLKKLPKEALNTFGIVGVCISTELFLNMESKHEFATRKLDFFLGGKIVLKALKMSLGRYPTFIIASERPVFRLTREPCLQYDKARPGDETCPDPCGNVKHQNHVYI